MGFSWSVAFTKRAGWCVFLECRCSGHAGFLSLETTSIFHEVLYMCASSALRCDLDFGKIKNFFAAGFIGNGGFNDIEARRDLI